VTQDEPGKDGGPRRYFVMLYDSVPGGTGYLHQLLAQEAGTLADVMRMALTTINNCVCNHDPDKDGCYRCVYQYRLGRNMTLVSRDRGKEVLTELVASLDQLEKVATISEIFINPSFDSVLESRFVESLRRMGGVGGLPPIKLVQDIVNGKSGYVLELAGQRYRIEPQCNLGPSEGVAISSKPDFVIWPWQAGSARKPIAVFCDGWTYHQHSLRDDALKRSAIVASGNFWVWSVTHEDVKAALSGAVGTDLDSPYVTFNRHDGTHAPASIPRAAQGAFAQHAVMQLLGWLKSPPAATGVASTSDAAVIQMQRNVNSDMAVWMQQLPEWMQLPGKSHMPSVSKANSQPALVWWWPSTCMSGIFEGLSAPGILVLDDLVDQTDEQPHLYWRRWLHLFNTFQTLPGMVSSTLSGLAAADCELLKPATAGTATVAGAPDQAGLTQEWLDLLEMTLQALRPGLRQLALNNAMPPIVGHELADSRGMVVAEAELAWVVLTFEQADLAPVWTASGWRVLVLDEEAATIDGVAWMNAVSFMLGLTAPELGEVL
jgi:DEAD/DEAH box helicase domain-containing protein